jgi:hypothetical protein
MIMGSATTSKKVTELDMQHHLSESGLFLFTIPKKISDEKLFSKVFEKCVSDFRMVPIGIYKIDDANAQGGAPMGSKCSKPFVILNPRENEKVSPKDKLFVLYSKNPNDENL